MHDIVLSGVDLREGAVQRLADSLGTPEQKRECAQALYRGIVNQMKVLLNRARAGEERAAILLPLLAVFNQQGEATALGADNVPDVVARLTALMGEITMERVKRLRDALSVAVMQLHVRGGHAKSAAISAARLSEINNVHGALYSIRTVYGCNEKNMAARFDYDT